MSDEQRNHLAFLEANHIDTTSIAGQEDAR